ncbi:MAG: response regulator transcription factor [Bacteroidales bacterium]
MRNAAFIVAIEPCLLRTGMVSILNRIPGVRVIREFDSIMPLLHFARSEPGHFLVISRSLFDRSEKLFLSQPSLLEKTVLLEEEPDPSGKSGLKNAISPSDPQEVIQNRVLGIVRQHEKPQSGPPGDSLTERERTIVRLVSLGLTNRQIADELFLSTHTVITHRKNIVSKLGIKSVSGLTVYAIVNNIITIEEVTSNP